MNKIKFITTSSLLATVFVLMSSTPASAETCYKLELRSRVDEAKCEPVPVVISSHDCADATKVVDEADAIGDIDCKSKPMKVRARYKDKTIASDLEAATLWGGVNFKAINPAVAGAAPEKKARKAAKKAVETPAISIVAAPTPAPVEAKAEVKAAAPAAESTDKKPEASAVAVKVSGFAWMEYERSQNFGYDGTSAITNFDGNLSGSNQDLSTFFTNMQVEFSKDKTTLTSIFEIGEVVSGESTTGGAQGGRQKVIEVRNLFLTHEFSDKWSARAGLLSLSSDPNSYILGDHHSALVVDYKNGGTTGSVWTAKAKESRQGITSTTTIYPDTYSGFVVASQVTEASKLTGYAVNRKTQESLNDSTGTSVLGKSEYNWFGLTADHAINSVYSMQATGISNQGKFTGIAAGSASDTLSAYLADIRFAGSWKDSGWDASADYLVTSGSSDSSISKRKGYVSPDPGANYGLTIATSDGCDDAPGVTKESIIGRIDQAEGMQIGILKVSKAVTDKLSTFVRYGNLMTANKSATTNSTAYGQEYDLNLTYELSPGTILQADYGYFKPGAFFTKTDAAQLFTTRVKFSF